MNGSLYLFPQNLDEFCDIDILAKALSSLEIIDSTLSETKHSCVYKAGQNFPRHIVFAGCSPYLKFEPEHANDTAFCHIALHGPFPEPLLITGQNTVKPRCPHCRIRLKDWQERINTSAQECPNCGKNITATSLDWRQNAAVGRSFVELRNVFPGEAAPSDLLIKTLKEATSFEWTFAWAGMKN